MKKAMFHKFTNFIQHAVDTFTPHLAPQEEFVYHWKSVTSYFVDNKDGGVRIEETALPEHLMSMLRIIQEEESDMGEAGTTGACLEYLLQHRLLETLYSLGRTDHPPGMKQLVLSFFTKLLSRISHPLLPHINVHRAVQRLVKACGESKASPTEKEEIEFLCTVCAKIKSDPYLVNFFIEIPKSDAERGQLRNPRPQAPFCLVDALLMLSDSQDARVSVKACEGLMLCASLPEQSAASALIQHTQFCQSIAGTMCQLYEKLPALVNPESIEALEAKWGFDAIMESRDKQGFTGKHQVISFLSWLDYCDQLIAVANPHVGEALAAHIHKSLFTDHFRPQLMQASESGAIVATTYVTRCLRTVCSPALLREFCFFLLGSERKLIGNDTPEHPLYKRLLDRCNHLSEEVCIATLKLFDTLLQKEDEHIIHCLLLRNLLGRSYLRDSSPPTPEDLKPFADANVGEKDEEKSQTSAEVVNTDSPTASQDGKNGSAERESLLLEGQESKVTQAESENKLDSNHPQLTSTKTSEEIPQTETTESSKLQTHTANASQPDTIESSNANDGDSVENSKENQTKEASSVSENDGEVGKHNDQTEHSALTAQLPVPSSPSSSYDSSSPSMSSSLSSGPSLSSPKYGRSEVHKVVNSFLSLLPEEAKSSYQTADSGYDMYLRDANKQFSNQEAVCKSWDWPKRPFALPDFQMDKFHEGSFLHMLFDKLLHMLDQNYSVNLLLTALIAKVALMPHPNLHEFLLDPFLPVVEGTKTLYSVLVKVANEIKHHQKKDTTFSQKLLMARKQLLGLVPTIHSDGRGFEDQSRMEAIIVLEEFCKELSAITFVKYHAAVTRF